MTVPNAEELNKLASSRPFEEYVLSQWLFSTGNDFFSDHKIRLEDYDSLYRGDWQRFATDIPKPEFTADDPLIENSIKQATHDISALAHEAQSSTTFIPRGETEKAETEALVLTSITDTLWEMGGGPRLERRLYMDDLAAGMMAVAAVYQKGKDYCQYRRLNPRYCYPDTRDGELHSMLYVEVIKTREAARLYPDKIGEVPASVDEKCQLIDYYTDEYVVKAVMFTSGGKNTSTNNVRIVSIWEHGLGCVPVAFVQADTADGAMRGHFDQAGKPMVARSNVIGFLLEYIESMVHAPFEAKNILNADTNPGPFVIYQHDATEQESFMRRVAPAAPAGAVFGVVQYLGEMTAGEVTQPPGRQGQVSQSIASAAFVASTQGRLTSVVRELQDDAAELRYQLNCLGLKIEETWYPDEEKPLLRAVGKKKTYNPKKDIKGWYHHTVQFGAAAGLSRSEADVRILQFVGAKGISRAEMRRQIDFIQHVQAMQNEIDQETISDAIVQRLATDQAIPLSILMKINTLMKKEGEDVDSAFAAVIAEAEEAEKQAAAQQAPTGDMLPTGAPATPEEEALALTKGGLKEGGQELEFQPPAYQTQFVGGR